jgi:hypothetical protein
MKYPKLRELATSRQMVDTFKGYNHNLRIGDGEFFDMKNLTSDYYPVLSPRKKRGVHASATSPQGMIAKDSLCYVDGTEFVINEYRVDMGLNDEPKQLVSMGAYVIILPDKKWINTKDLTDFGNIEAEVQTHAPVSFKLCKLTGADYATDYSQAAEPEDPANMTLWVDTSTVPHSLKQWSETSSMWVTIGTTYVKIESPGIGVPFEKYDGITISGLTGVLTDNVSGNAIEDTTDLAALEGSAVVWEKGDDYIVVVGILDQTRTITEPITISRKMPHMDFVVESKNRLWGCRYGLNANGDVVNEIYASKLGDFKNWSCFMGLSTDSYAASVGTDGQFTGAITHLGYPLFFKETVLHKVYGDYPANIQIQDTACRGVQRGCERSLAIVNEMLYYKSRSGVCAYDGSLPVEMSYVLGEEVYGEAVAGGHGNKYYISMQDVISEEYHLFVYDTAKRMWHKEDNLHADAFCSCRGEMYAIDHESKNIIAMLGSGEKESGDVEWMAETGEIGITSPDMKYISRITLRMSMNVGSEVRIYARYDFCDEWELLWAMRSDNLRSFSIPIRPKRCDYMKLRIEGEGMTKIYSITKTIEQGSELS